jgi:hypothetical protein
MSLFTFRVDRLPAFASSTDVVLDTLFENAHVGGLFSDFPDPCVNWLQTHRRLFGPR